MRYSNRVLMFETGHFATLWYNIALAFGLDVDFVPTNWRHGVMPEIVAEKLAEDKTHQIKSVMVVHNETSTGDSEPRRIDAAIED